MSIGTNLNSYNFFVCIVPTPTFTSNVFKEISCMIRWWCNHWCFIYIWLTLSETSHQIPPWPISSWHAFCSLPISRFILMTFSMTFIWRSFDVHILCYLLVPYIFTFSLWIYQWIPNWYKFDHPMVSNYIGCDLKLLWNRQSFPKRFKYSLSWVSIY